ncbi:50S ribosomal protein L29 [Candidatus Uhrbacteria bacterium]|nr:50S ribosomal protein L29 [Candidatus Uhrbacteria bacterium]
MDIKTLKGKSKESLAHDLTEARKQLSELEFKCAASQLKQVREIRETKKTIARIKTLLTSTT